AGHALVPAGDNLLGAECKLERLAAIDRAVKLLALGAVVRQPPGVVHPDLVSGSSDGPIACLCVRGFYHVWHLDHLIVGCVRSPDGRRDSKDGKRQSGAGKSDRYHGFLEPGYATRSTAPFLDSTGDDCNVGSPRLNDTGDSARSGIRAVSGFRNNDHLRHTRIDGIAAVPRYFCRFP